MKNIYYFVLASAVVIGCNNGRKDKPKEGMPDKIYEVIKTSEHTEDAASKQNPRLQDPSPNEASGAKPSESEFPSETELFDRCWNHTPAGFLGRCGCFGSRWKDITYVNGKQAYNTPEECLEGAKSVCKNTAKFCWNLKNDQEEWMTPVDKIDQAHRDRFQERMNRKIEYQCRAELHYDASYDAATEFARKCHK